MQIVSIGDNLHESQILFPGKNKKKYLKMSLFFFTQSAKP